MDTPWLDLDLHRLELRFAGARLVEPRAVERLARSIEHGGQIVPCIAVSDPPAEAFGGGERLVLIDGYRRVAALRRLGRDTARVECWRCDLTEGLLGVLARAHMRSFAAIEEALLVRELVQGLGLSQHEIARRCGRDVSWVSRRLCARVPVSTVKKRDRLR
jgi:ParB family chromosome partitioning protein